MASRKVLYDADRASKERSEAVVVIGGQNFIQRQITMDVMTELRLLRQANEEGDREAEADEAQGLTPKPEDDDDRKGGLYAQLAILLRTEEPEKDGTNVPPIEHFEERLDIRDARELIFLLLPGRRPGSDGDATAQDLPGADD